jgi:hypothetical protein
LVHLAMRNRNLAPYRGRVVSEATGRVLEVGVGSGLNLPFYGESASHVIGLDPSPDHRTCGWIISRSGDVQADTRQPRYGTAE